MNMQIAGRLDGRLLLVLGVVFLVGVAWYGGPLGLSNVGDHMGKMGGNVHATSEQQADEEERTACCRGRRASMESMHRSMHARMHGGAPGQANGATNDMSDDLGLEAQTEQWLEGTRGLESVEDRTGESEVVVEVGAGNGLTYAPAAVRVDPGTTIRWKWTGSGGLHDVAFVNTDVRTSLRGEQGAEYTYTFAESGEYRYECTPHASVGMRGVVIVEAN